MDSIIDILCLTRFSKKVVVKNNPIKESCLNRFCKKVKVQFSGKKVNKGEKLDGLDGFFPPVKLPFYHKKAAIFVNFSPNLRRFSYAFFKTI